MIDKETYLTQLKRELLECQRRLSKEHKRFSEPRSYWQHWEKRRAKLNKEIQRIEAL